MKIKNLTLILSILATGIGFGQKNLSLYNLRGTPQANSINPSFFPKSKIYLSLPMGMTNLGVTNSGFSFNDLFTKRADDSLVINTEKVINGLDKTNLIGFESSIEIFGLGLKLRDIYFNFTINTKFQANFIYPKDLMKFALEGNGKSFIGERASLDGLGLNLNAFTEYSVGLTKEINDKLTVGGRFKLISGIVNVNSKKTNLGIFTDPNTFAITIDGSAEVNSSNISQFYNDTTSTMAQKSKDMISSLTNFANKGVGLDFGATYKINDKFSVNASVIDLGTIHWKTNITSYKTNDFNFKFEGVDLKEYFSDTSSNNDAFSRLKDSIPKAFGYSENNDAYTTSLHTKIYIGGNYQINKSFNAGALLLNEFTKGRYTPSFSLSVNAALKSWLSATLNYSIINKTFTNIGVGVSLRGGPVQFFIMSDNVFAFVNPLNARGIHLCGGLSVFIKDKTEKKKDKTEKVN